MKIHQHNLPYKQTEKNHSIISLNAEKAFDKFQYNFTLKTIRMVKDTRHIPNHDQSNIQQANCQQLNGERFHVIPLKSGTRQDCPLSPYLFNIVLKF